MIVAGSRSITKASPVKEAVEEAPFEISELVQGGARGVDLMAKNMASAGVIDVQEVTEFSANWDEHGKAAGPIRNGEMADYADALIAVWDGESSGTRDMIEKALDRSIPVYAKTVAYSDGSTGGSSGDQ